MHSKWVSSLVVEKTNTFLTPGIVLAGILILMNSLPFGYIALRASVIFKK